MMRMRSRTAIRCGEVKRPIFCGMEWVARCWARMEEAKAQVLPLPFVPATCRMLRRFRSEGWEVVLVHEHEMRGVGGSEKGMVQSSRCARGSRAFREWRLHRA